jgi:DNA-binding transcriptional ArsR family regulator
MNGEVDIASAARVLAEPARARVLLALMDRRALPASVLAGEAGVAPSTASEHLAKLVDAGFLTVERHGRHRYFRIAGPPVADVIEALGAVAPAAPVRSLREGTRANALREARTCYDHLAGRLGTALMGAMIDRGVLTGGDGRFDPDAAREDRLSAPGHDIAYELTDQGAAMLREHLGLEAGGGAPLRYCVDWSEQRHHLAGRLGAALADRMFELGWIRRTRVPRAVRVTDAGRDGLRAAFGLEL